jgi:nucleotide-binding universal stress UspA family protein
MDLSPADSALLSWLRFFVKHNGLPQRVTLLHNIFIDVDWIENHGHAYRSDEVQSAIRAEINEKLNEAHWPDELRDRTHVQVEQNDSTDRLIQELVKSDSIDTVIFGRKTYYPGRGGMFKRLLRNIRSLEQVILVPESAPHMLDRVLIPVDFSPRSAELAQSGIHWCSEKGIEPLLCHVFRLPQVYFPFLPFDKLIENKTKEAKKKMDAFAKKLDVSETPRSYLQYAESHTVSEGIRMIAAQERADLILMARKPKTKFEDAVIDDTLLQLISSPVDLPIWIDK